MVKTRGEKTEQIVKIVKIAKLRRMCSRMFKAQHEAPTDSN